MLVIPANSLSEGNLFIKGSLVQLRIIILKIVTALVLENGHFLLLPLPFYSFYINILLKGTCLQSYKDFGKLGSHT